MSLNRDDMLRELELLPVWTLRSASAGVPTAKPTARSVQPVPEVEAARGEVHHAAAAEIPDTSQHANETAGVAEASRMQTIARLDWDALQDTVISCHACDLAATRTQTVFGVGDPNADWLFVGEAPGMEEDRWGEPFVGQAGKLLDNMLAAIKLSRGQNVYIANVLKCRPPENRNPQGREVMECDPFLKRQVELIQPRIIVALGKFAAQSLLQTDAAVASLRGKLHDYTGVPVVVTYHPAYLLRNLPDKAKAWEDLCFALSTMRTLQNAVSASS